MCAFVVDFAAKHDCFAANARADDRHGKRPQPFRKHLRQKSSRKFHVQHLKIPNPPTSGTVWRLSLSSFRVTATGSPLRICVVNNGEQSALQMLIPVNSRQVKTKKDLLTASRTCLSAPMKASNAPRWLGGMPCSAAARMGLWRGTPSGMSLQTQSAAQTSPSSTIRGREPENAVQFEPYRVTVTYSSTVNNTRLPDRRPYQYGRRSRLHQCC